MSDFRATFPAQPKRDYFDALADEMERENEEAAVWLRKVARWRDPDDLGAVFAELATATRMTLIQLFHYLTRASDMLEEAEADHLLHALVNRLVVEVGAEIEARQQVA